jgi:Tol biopolymer transport system component
MEVRIVMLKSVFAGIAIVLLMVGCASEQVDRDRPDAPVLSGPYLGQEPPGMEGRLFAPGVLSTGMDELNAVFLPGGREVFFSLHRRGMEFVLVHMKEENGRWTEPEIAPFSGEYSDVDPAVSPDGKRVYYCSNRPRSGSGDPEGDFDIWYVEKTESGWSDPVNAGAPINSEADEFYPSFTEAGTMYFQSRREGCIGLADIYRTELVDGKYETAECLPETINSPGFEGDAFIAPDESYLIVSTQRDVNIGHADLYISFRSEDGSWPPLQNMGEAVNSVGGENCQILSPCGKYLFYTSRRFTPTNRSYESIKKGWSEPENGLGDIYWIDANIIEAFRSQ